jgi:hypothetical protein
MANERLRQFAGNLNSFSLVDVVEEVLSDIEDDIVQIQQAQLERGEKADNTFMPEYDEETLVNRGSGIKSSNGLIALYDTGSFWGGMRAMAGFGLLEIDSNDTKSDMLIEIYGEEILGLNKVSLDRLKEITTPLIRDKVKEKLRV